jgi:mRNA interferase HigB
LDQRTAIAFSGFANQDKGRPFARRDQGEAGMHVISRKRLREFWDQYDDAKEPLARWFKLAENAEWTNFSDLRADFPSADLVEQFTVVNIGWNKYRLVLEIFFRDQVVLVRHVLPHADYDKGKWKG